MKKEELLIIYNQESGRRKSKFSAERLAARLGGAKVCEIKEVKPELLLNRRANIIFGGDGTLSSITASLSFSKESIPLVLAGGGTENHLYKLSLQKGKTIKVRDLTSLDSLEGRTYSHYPGEVEGVGMFLVNLGLGNIETAWATGLAKLREKVPAAVGSYLSYFNALVELYPGRLTFNMVLVDDKTGPLKIPAEQKLSTRELLAIEITGAPVVRVAKALLAGCFWRLGITMPKGIFKVSRAEEIAISAGAIADRISLDGEVVPVGGNLKIRRANSPLSVVALVR